MTNFRSNHRQGDTFLQLQVVLVMRSYQDEQVVLQRSEGIEIQYAVMGYATTLHIQVRMTWKYKLCGMINSQICTLITY